LERPGLPTLYLDQAAVQAPATGAGNGGAAAAGSYRVTGTLRREGGGPHGRVEVTVETAKGETTQAVVRNGAAAFAVETAQRPLRLVVDKYGQTAKANGGPFTPVAYNAERERTLIVYGTLDEEAANRIAAEKLQDRIRTSWSNETLPVKAD